MWVRGRSSSLKMSPFDRPHTISYWLATVSIALSCTIFDLFDVQQYSELEIWVKCHSRSLTMAPFESLCTVSYSRSTATIAVSLAISEIFRREHYSLEHLLPRWEDQGHFLTNDGWKHKWLSYRGFSSGPPSTVNIRTDFRCPAVVFVIASNSENTPVRTYASDIPSPSPLSQPVTPNRSPPLSVT